MTPNQIQKLVKQRGVAKTQLTRIKTFVDAFVPSANNMHELKVRLRHLPEILSNYHSVQSVLETEDTESDHADDRAQFEDTSFEVEGKIEMMMMMQAEERNVYYGESQRSGVSHVPHGSLRLPSVSLPHFDGKYEEWLPFSDSFKLMVHENQEVLAIQKYHYLLSCLKGQAAQLIQNLPITASNYQVAWQLLQDRYENKKLIAATHTRELLNMKAVQRESASELRQFLNCIRCNLNALKAMNIDQPLGDILMSQMVLEKLDKNTRREWEIQESRQSFPPLSELLTFLECKSQALENIQPSSSSAHSLDNRAGDSRFKQPKTFKCAFCSNQHPLFKCTSFITAEMHKRRECVENNSLCLNCLQAGHLVKECTSSNCRKCDGRHHTLLHLGNSDNNQVSHSHQLKPTVTNERGQGSYHIARPRTQIQVLLSTAIVLVEDSMGQLHKCRALIDCGSQSNLVTEDLVQRLMLKKIHNRIQMQGVNNVSAEANFTTTVQLHSAVSSYKASLTCSVLPHITGQLPSAFVDSQLWNLPRDIQLADPTFHEPGPIDMLIGAEVCFYLLQVEKRTRPGDFPVLQNTELGWILSGRYQLPHDIVTTSSVTSCFVCQDDNLTHQLQRFWELEEMHTSTKSDEELHCEMHFQTNTTRDETGRYVVRLPKRSPLAKLGDSCQQAKSRFHHLERKLLKNEELRGHYVKFMAEYEELGHMKEVCSSTHNENKPTYYLPHHAVFKPSSSTTKTRVVFDGSAKTTTGVSLNDSLMVGPTVQQDLYSIVLRFRTHRIAFTADIAKMYRQIRMHPDDSSLQRILWRTSPDQPLKTYELSTVTYGTASAPFLATRCLQQLAEEECDKYPNAAKILRRDFYIDDVLCGCDNIQDALQLQAELIALLNCGQFPLRKWCSNHSAILEAVPPEHREMQLPLCFNSENSIKTLGLSWHPTSDKLLIANNSPCNADTKVTKRVVLSLVASIFDPLGLVSPVVITYKMFLQRLWLHSLNWDDELPSELYIEWQRLHSQLIHVNSLQVDRCVLENRTQTSIQLHGFSDASEKAYGCSLYIRSTYTQGKTTSNLLCSRSRVAPVKKVTLPRLELLGAELLAKLVHKTLPILHLKIDNICLWTDSTVVLSWIASPASRWKTFVANRVANIQHHTTVKDWNHVSSSDNPADLISRGIKAADLQDQDLWWHGPLWLHQPSEEWPADVTLVEDDNIPEEKKVLVTALTMHDHHLGDILQRFSKLSKITRVVAYCLRFMHNSKQPLNKLSGPLSGAEIRTALTTCIKMAQTTAYRQEIRDLVSNKQVTSKSSLRDLHPFLDDQQVLRVGGRLRQSELAYDNKHQTILPPNHHFTGLIIMAEHLRLSHAGPQLLIASLRQQYWIPRAKQTVKSVIHKCLPCFKLKVSTSQQLMGQLPLARVQPSRPFLNTGTDYAGPFHIKQGSVRSKTTIKCYIAVFVCLATKAIHLELVTGLTSEAFIAAFRRFTARRGKCLNLYSDNGTNFVGANRELKELQELFQSQQHRSNLANYASSEQLQWHFIPPRAPHFGGLWEASVKSMKYHLKRVAGNAVLTLEEFTTLLTQIEACLNSRPITVLSNDPSDPTFLCPGHFLIGGPLMSYPEPCLSELSESRLSRWQRVQKMYQQLWKRWSTDYLNSLQQRGKWTTPESSLQPGMVVLVKEDHMPPLQWKLAVVTETFPGKDGHVRVANIRTSSGELMRPITKLIPLPYEHSATSN